MSTVDTLSLINSHTVLIILRKHKAAVSDVLIDLYHSIQPGNWFTSSLFVTHNMKGSLTETSEQSQDYNHESCVGNRKTCFNSPHSYKAGPASSATASYSRYEEIISVFHDLYLQFLCLIPN